MFSATASLILSQFVFVGGDGAALASQCMETLKKPVFLAETTGRYEPFAFDFLGEKQFLTRLTAKAALLPVSTPGHVTSRHSYLPSFFYGEQKQVYQLEFMDKAKCFLTDSGLVVDGMRVSSTKGGSTYPAGLTSKLDWSRKVDMHWLLQAMIVTVACQELGESEFMKGLASTLPANLVTTEERYHFDLDPARFRALWIARFENHRVTRDLNVVEEAMIAASIEAVKSLSTAQIREFMKKPRQFHHIWIPADSQTALTRAFRSYIDLYRRGADIPTQTFDNYYQVQAMREGRQARLKLVVWDKPWRVTFYNLGRVDFLLPTEKDNAWVALSSG